jgi:hypothetical protein
MGEGFSYHYVKRPRYQPQPFEVAGTGFEPMSAAADMSPPIYFFKYSLIFSLINSRPIPVLKYFSLFIASDLVGKDSK